MAIILCIFNGYICNKAFGSVNKGFYKVVLFLLQIIKNEMYNSF